MGISQPALGELLNLAFQQIQKYESGANRISASTLHQMSRVLEVPITYFFEDIEPQPLSRVLGLEQRNAANDEAPMRNFASSREGVALNRQFMRIADPRVRDKVLELVAALAAQDPG